MPDQQPNPQPALHPYLDPIRFPLTTQGNLSLQQQKMIDAFNLDELTELVESGKSMSERQQQAWAELKEKAELSKAERGK